MTTTKTTNVHLQEKLDLWRDMLNQAVALPFGSNERKETVRTFCTTFVPADVNVDDTLFYADGLCTDEEAFSALVREINQCASGERVESIAQGDEWEHSFVFTLLPPEGIGLNIVRELSFVSSDGVEWTAEG